MELFDYKLTYEKIASLKAFKCSHCNRIFSTQVCNGFVLGRVPLLMPCSHTICEECIIRMAKSKKIECKICNYNTILENPEKWPNLFPVDRYMFGALLNQNANQTSSPNVNPRVFSYQTHSLAGMTQKILPPNQLNEKTQCSQDDCGRAATMMCMNCCGEIYCTTCDKRVHKSIRILKDHVRYPIDVGDLSALSANCTVHSDASAEYYCFTCANMLCSKCIIKDHSGHAIISIEDKNVQDLPAFKEMMKKGRYLLKSMETTVKEVNMEIANSQKNFKPTQTEYEIIKHFSMLHSTLQILEASMLDKFYRGQASKVDALHRLSEELTSNIEILQPLLNTGKMLLTNKNMDKLLISELHGKIEANLNLPCEIIEEKTGNHKPSLKFITDNSILEKLQQHCSINVVENFTYKLIPKSVFDESKFEDDDSETFSITSETDSTSSFNRLNQSSSNTTISSSSASSSGGEYNLKKKSGCRTRLSLSGSEPTFHSPPSQQKKVKHKNEEMVEKGMEYGVYVSHITNPSLFYVQLSDKKKYIEDLTNKYANYAEHAIIPTSVEIGKIYIVQYSDEKGNESKWYRGRVDNTIVAGLHNLYEVFFIDYGNTSFVTINKIRNVKNIFTQDPYFAYQCRLHGIMSLQDKWNNNVLKDMVEFISCQHELKMYVVNNDKGILDVTLFSHVASISEFLIIAGYAQKIADSEMNARRTFNYSETKISSSIQNFQKGQKYIVSVTHIINPLHMYVRVEQYKDVIVNIETGMTSKYNKIDAKHFIFNPNTGMYCAALLTIKNESKWRRAEIIEVPCNGMIKVYAIDHGITEYVDWRCIRKLQNNYKNVDAQAIKIALTHVKPNTEHDNDNEWPSGTNEFLRKQLNNKITSMVVDQESKTSLLVTLYECHQEEDVCINALLVDEGYALSTGQKSQQLKLIKDTKVEYYRQMSTSMIMDDKYWVAISMVHVESPGCFYVMPLKWSEKRDKFTKELADFYSDEKSPNKAWTIDAVCIVKSKEDNLYYRAVVVDALKNDRYKVFMKDIIRTEITTGKDMFTLEDQFGIHDYTIKCRLGGMIPTGGTQTWPHSAKEYFIQILELYSHLYITQSEPVSDKTLPVELIAKWEDNNGPLNAASVHKAVINALIIEAGLAIPVKSYTNESKLNEADKIEPLQFEPITVQGDEEPSQYLGPKPTSWLKPYRLLEKKFQAWPSYVDHDGFIYIQTAKTKSMLSNVRRVLGKYFKGKSYDKSHVWNVGDMCTVQYHLDKSFCRGTVLETTADGKIHVQLIDYGNVEECTPEELRTDVLMTDQPPLTIKCALANVAPKTPNNKWPITILDTLHMTIVEKECEAFLENDDYEDDQMPEITLIINHICINTTIMTWDWGKIKEEVGITDKGLSSSGDNDDDDDDDNSVIIVESSNDDDNLEDADVVLEKEMKYTYVQLPENINKFEGIVVNFIDYQSPLIEPDFIQELMSNTADEFQKMLMDINQFAPYLPKICEPVVGMPCIALFGADNFWYRAEILNIDRKEIKVLFVDYGNIDIIPLDDIKEMKEEWLEFSVQMLKCVISGIQISPLKDNLEVMMQMKEEIEGKHVICEIQKYQPNIELKLMCKDDPQKYVYQKLIDEDYILECN